MVEEVPVSTDKLLADFKLVLADAEELLRATAGQAGEKLAETRERIQEHLATAKASLADTQATALEQAKAVGTATDDYVHKNPWQAVGIAAGVGLLLGLLMSRR